MARQRAIHAERDIVFTNSIRMSVCPSNAGTVSKRMDTSSHFQLSARGIIVVFKPYRRYTNPRETPSAGR